jgi:hypothetical protein
MAAANKFDVFVRDLCNGVHAGSFGSASPSDTWKIYLSNAAPSSSADSVKTDLAEISTTGGYQGPQSVGLGRSQSGGVITLTAQDVVFTCETGSPTMPPFQYVVLYNDTPVSPLDPLIVWWDYGQSLSLDSAETFTVDFGASFATIQ